MDELWTKRFDRNAIAILNTALVYYQKPTFPSFHRNDYHDNKEYLENFDISKKTVPKNKLSLEDIKEADEYATSRINSEP